MKDNTIGANADAPGDSAAPYRVARFVHGAAPGGRLPADEGREVAFAGRSNSGKSSAINAITGRRGLARTSRTPGRTQQINFFEIDAGRRLVDLPGYGYAQVPEALRRQWGPQIENYLLERRALRGVILTVDIRRAPEDAERMLLDWCAGAGLPLHVLLTKADKFKRGECARALGRWRAELGSRPGADAGVQAFSAKSRAGVDEARAVLGRWLEIGQKKAPESREGGN